jgi:hypothetical protein
MSFSVAWAAHLSCPPGTFSIHALYAEFFPLAFSSSLSWQQIFSLLSSRTGLRSRQFTTIRPMRRASKLERLSCSSVACSTYLSQQPSLRRCDEYPTFTLQSLRFSKYAFLGAQLPFSSCLKTSRLLTLNYSGRIV